MNNPCNSPLIPQYASNKSIVSCIALSTCSDNKSFNQCEKYNCKQSDRVCCCCNSCKSENLKLLKGSRYNAQTSDQYKAFMKIQYMSIWLNFLINI